MKNEISPTSNADKATLIGDEYVSQVRTFGAWGTLPTVYVRFSACVGKKKRHL